MYQALKLVLHATLYSTCSMLLYCIAGYTRNGLVYSLTAIANLLSTIGYPFIRCLKRYPACQIPLWRGYSSRGFDVP